MPAGLLRDMSKMRTMNDGTRTLSESIMLPEVGDAIRDWVRSRGGGVLIGDAALCYHARPRHNRSRSRRHRLEIARPGLHSPLPRRPNPRMVATRNLSWTPALVLSYKLN